MQRVGLLETSGARVRIAGLRGLLSCGRLGASIALAAACAVSGAAAASTTTVASGTLFRVTLKATLTKDWSYVDEGELDGCPLKTQVQGRRVVTLRSTKPTLVRVRFAGGRAVYSPAWVRSLLVLASQSGVVATNRALPPSCVAREARRSTCAPLRRASRGAAVRFFRSRRNEVSFARSPEYAAFPATCPLQTASVRAERPSLDLAEGEISEAELRDPRIGFQTVTGSAIETTDFEGDGDGKVVVRVSWALRFERTS
jgi:hypothetical protein